MKYLHTMIRVSDPAATVRFFELLGLKEQRRFDSEKGRFTLIFLAAPGDEEAQVELTHNWDPEPYGEGRNFGHLAYRVDDIYETCQRLMDAGVTINRPPRDGHMAFVRTPDNISVELLQGRQPAACRTLGLDGQYGALVMAAAMTDLEIVRIPALSDNYIWLVHDPVSLETMVVDPAVADPVLAAADERGWKITAIWNTHWHPDHTGGNGAIKAATGAVITGPAAEAARIPTLDATVSEGDVVRLGGHAATVYETPAHTAGHISFHFADDAAIFVGDTLFAMGCGRLFEGTADQMFANMQRYATLSDDTVVYCAHEYTESNARYARVAEPNNDAIARRLDDVVAARARGAATVPTTIGLERATNPFLRAGSVAQLAERRAAKDGFTG